MAANVNFEEDDDLFEEADDVLALYDPFLQGFQFEPRRDAIVGEEDAEEDVNDEAEDVDERRMGREDQWCVCGSCRTETLGSEQECRCCKEQAGQRWRTLTEFTERSCIVDDYRFHEAVLPESVLRNVLVCLLNVRGDSWRINPPSNSGLRWAAYRQFTWMVYGCLGPKVRIVIPACAVAAIRAHYPSEDGIYEGYHEANPYAQPLPDAQVDCFSFGMFIYELLTCHQPFIDYPSPGNLNLLVYQGGRPHISAAVTDYPSYILDLMTLCWSQDARQRPTSQEIHDLIIQPEFCHLLDAVSMETDAPIAATGVINPSDVDCLDTDHNMIWDSMTHTAEKPMTQVWLSVATSRDISHIQVYSYASNKCCDKVVLVVPRKVVCMCEVSGDMWCIDDNSTLTIFSSQTFNPTFNHKITGLKPKSKVMGMFHAGRRREVVILSDVGDLVVYSDSFLDEKVEVFSRVLEPYPGNVFCATLVDLDNVHYELWTGHNDRSICVRDLYTDPSLTSLNHDTDRPPITSHCVFLVTQCAGVAGAKLQTTNSVWSYNYPGSVVYHWDGAKKVVLCQIDVSAIDLDSLGVESHKTNTNIQVTALQVLNSFLYIGTTSGTIIITMATTLKPITLIHCHGNQDYYIRDLIAFHDSANFPGVLSIGKGYNNLLSKSMRHPSSDTMVRNVDMSINADKRQYLDEKLVDSYGYLLSWLAEDWQHF